MGKILCSTRGGDASVRTQKSAIDLALSSGDELVFFIAFDMEFLAEADFALRADVVSEEVDKMCDFLMLMAVERAAAMGKEATYLVRQGAFVEEIEKVVQKENITLAVLGRPEGHASRFALHQLEELAEKLEADTSVPFRILPEE
jgi:Universal stress protein family